MGEYIFRRALHSFRSLTKSFSCLNVLPTVAALFLTAPTAAPNATAHRVYLAFFPPPRPLRVPLKCSFFSMAVSDFLPHSSSFYFHISMVNPQLVQLLYSIQLHTTSTLHKCMNKCSLYYRGNRNYCQTVQICRILQYFLTAALVAYGSVTWGSWGIRRNP